jgi:outer membrane receptor protein involved in Fe transport
MRRWVLVAAFLLAPSGARAQVASPDYAPEVVVIGRQLDQARTQIQPSLGATTYTFSPDALADISQGDNAPLNQVLLQAPAVAQDSFGQIHVRGDHAGLQYRLDGVQLPEGINIFSQTLEDRAADTIALLTGALPAQYGFLQAGVVDIRLKSGINDSGGSFSAYGGQRDWYNPNASWGGRYGVADWFATGDFLHNDIGIENPTDSLNPIHDATSQYHGLVKGSLLLDDSTRLSLIAGVSDAQFQIPNNPGQTPLYTVLGVSNFNSAELGETQREITDFGIVSLQKHFGSADVQVSAFTRFGSLNFSPDPLGDLIFLGLAQTASRSSTAIGTQLDASWQILPNHTLRAGYLIQGERTVGSTISSVLAVDADGNQTSDVPEQISQSSGKSGAIYGLYLQDEWRVLPKLTLNYGVRFDVVHEFTHEHQASPRVNMVWTPLSGTTLHAGYARYFTPPPFELVAATQFAPFVGTTAAPSVLQDSPVRAERANYYDLGIQQRLFKGASIAIDGYYKDARDLLDEGQFGAPIILTPFNYAHGKVGGVTVSPSYTAGPLQIYGNAAYSHAVGTNIVSAQFNFSPDELAYIANHYIYLDHDQTWTASGGVSYVLPDFGEANPLTASADMIVGSGLRASTPTVPNGAALPDYVVVNASLVQTLNLGVGKTTELRLDALNLLDEVYEIRNGTGVGVGAPQFGLRRTILAGVRQSF